MDITLQSPALLFPAITLLLLAYTSRFIALINIIRTLKQEYLHSHAESLLTEINFLRQRVILIRNMQLFGIISFILCVVSMFLFYMDKQSSGEFVFATSLLTMILSLLFSFKDTLCSVKSLDLHLKDIEEKLEK